MKLISNHFSCLCFLLAVSAGLKLYAIPPLPVSYGMLAAADSSAVRTVRQPMDSVRWMRRDTTMRRSGPRFSRGGRLVLKFTEIDTGCIKTQQ